MPDYQSQDRGQDQGPMARIALLICLLTFAVQQVSAVNDCVMDYQLKGNLSATGHAGQGGYPNLIQKKGRLGYEGWKPNGADSQGTFHALAVVWQPWDALLLQDC